MVKTRLYFLKRLYPDYLILFKDKKYYKVFGNDLLIIKDILNKDVVYKRDIKKLSNVNFLIIENLKILYKKEQKVNDYNLILKKQKLILMLRKT